MNESEQIVSSETKPSPKLTSLFPSGLPGSIKAVLSNLLVSNVSGLAEPQLQTREAFSKKWSMSEYDSEEFKKSLEFQKRWYLSLYGFESEEGLARYLRYHKRILDAGAGKAGKASWFAQLSPSTLIVAADISDSIVAASEYYKNYDNMVFIQCDIANMPFFPDNHFDYISCDQVIHHTKEPPKTFKELVRVTRPDHDIACYVYRRKALPRELLDEYFREFSQKLTHEQVMELSAQLTELGRLLSENKEEVEFPSIPLLGIEGGKMTIQRFIYWNFIKCYWNEELGRDASVLTNYDWYSPAQAFRYSEEEFRKWIEEENLDEVHFHRERACYSGRFKKRG
jgi:ubiquinone/menaquinone biosynthesis C-methylase UbiE